MSKEKLPKIIMIPTDQIGFQEDTDLSRFQQLGTVEYNAGIKELAANIDSLGLLNPILVIKGKTTPYAVVAGNRRLAACKVLDWPMIPCIVHTEDNFQLAFSEQIQRSDLTDVERGVWIDRAVEHLKGQKPYKESEKPTEDILEHLSAILGKSPRTLALWRQMAKGFSPEERQRVVEGQSANAIQKEHAAKSGQTGGAPCADGTPAKARHVLSDEDKAAKEKGKLLKSKANAFINSALKMRESLQFICENQLEYQAHKPLLGAFKALQKAMAVAEKSLAKKGPVVALNHI